MIWFGLACLLVFLWGLFNLAFLYLWSRAHDIQREREARPEARPEVRPVARHRA